MTNVVSENTDEPLLLTADFSPSEFHFFGTLKEARRKKGFESDDKVVEEVKKCYKEGIFALVSRWRNVVEGDGGV